MQHELSADLGRDYPVSVPQEPWLQHLGQLSGQQIVAVAVAVLAVLRAHVAPLEQRMGNAMYVNINAGAGSGKTTVLNVIT
jgi:hypothetical protein